MAISAKLRKAAEGLGLVINPHEAHVGIGDDELHVYVTASKSVKKRLAMTLPATVDGFPVKVEYVGKIKPA
jgi:hypothetical protein